MVEKRTHVVQEGSRPVGVKVVGVGGCGSNAVTRMVRDHTFEVGYAVINTDENDFEGCPVEEKIVIGEDVTRKSGTGGNQELGGRAAEQSIPEIKQTLYDTGLLFLTAGMGGGTGTGATPVIASLAREMGIYTVGVVTLPFAYEGTERVTRAENGVEALRGAVDVLITISNEKLNCLVEEDASFEDAMNLANDVLAHAVKKVGSYYLGHGNNDPIFEEVKEAFETGGSEVIQDITTLCSGYR